MTPADGWQHEADAGLTTDRHVAAQVAAQVAAWRISLAAFDSCDHLPRPSRHVATGGDATPTLPRFTHENTC